MIDLLFDGTSGVPTPLHVYGAPLSGSARKAIGKCFADFTHAARLGVYDSLSRRYKIDAQTTLELKLNHGVVTARAYVTPVIEEQDYYGGIVLHLQTINEPAWFEDADYLDTGMTGADLFPPAEIREDLVEVSLSDAMPGQPIPSRPAVPGPLGEGATNRLIFQIARNGDLSDRPVARGLVKIFRIRDPLVGEVASHDFDGRDRYIVSGRVVLDGAQHRVQDWACCGQVLDVPPTPVLPAAFDSMRVRLFSVGFRPEKFEKGGEAQGVLILAYINQLYAYDSSNAEAGWQLLAAVGAGFQRQYGYDFTDAVDANSGIRSISCTGTDGDGSCSSFHVTITPRAALPALITGSLNLLEVINNDPPPAEMYALNQRVEWLNGDWTGSILDRGAGYPDPDARYVTTEQMQTYSRLTISAEFRLGGGGQQHDDFIGGQVNPERPQTIVTYESTTISDPAELVTQSTASMNISVFQPGIGGPITYSLSGAGVGDPDHEFAESARSGVVRGDQYVRNEYAGFDHHRRRLAVRSVYERSGTWEKISETGDAQIVMGAASFDIQLVNRALEEVVSLDYSRMGLVQGMEGDSFLSLVFPDFGAAVSYGDAANFGQLGTLQLTLIDFFPAWLPYYIIPFPTYDGQTVDGYPHVVERADPIYTLQDYVGPTFSAQVNLNSSSPAVIDLIEYESYGDVLVPAGATPWPKPVQRYHYSQDYASSRYIATSAEPPPKLLPVENRVHVDPRTDAYIAQLFYEGERDDDGIHVAAFDVIVGNEDGHVRLVDVVNEWVALTGGSSEYDHVVICRETATDVSLI